MAEEEIVEEGQEEQETQVEEQPKRSKFPVKFIIIGIVAISFIAGGIFVFKSGLLSGLSSESEAALVDENKAPEMGPIYPLDTFIVNLVGGRGKNYLKAKIELELDNEKTITVIDKRLPQLRDSILTMLSSKAHEDINTLEGKFQLRAEIISTLNQYIHDGKVQNVYFTDFIVQ
jgi:flagellar FliL protein